jgi:hypothetical protein
MVEPTAIWSTRQIVTDKTISLTQNVILSYARDALHTIIRRIDRLHEIVKSSAIKNVFIDPEIPPLLSDLGFQQGLASTLLFNDAPRSKNESTEAYGSRIERIAYVKKKCGNISTTILASRKIRNALTHLDEYLVKALKKPNTGWCIDIAMLHRDQFSAVDNKTNRKLEIGFCRAYISVEDKLLHLGNEISLTGLREECTNVLDAVWPKDA